MLYLAGIVGLVVLALMGALKFEINRVTAAKADLKVSEANVGVCKADNVTLAKSIDGLRDTYKGSQDTVLKLMTDQERKQKEARDLLAKHQQQAQDSAAQINALKAQAAKPSPTSKNEQCDQATRTLSDLRTSRLRNDGAAN